MIKKRLLNLLLSISLAANAIVIVTWVITNATGHDFMSPAYLFRNMLAVAAIVAINVIFGWFYSKNTHTFLVGSLHFGTAALTFILLGLWARWFPANGGIILTAIVFFIVLWFAIWMIHYWYWKNEIKKLNEKLG